MCVTSNGRNLNSSSLVRTSDYRIFLHIDTPLICLFISYFTPKYTHSMDKYTANSALLFTTNKPTKVKQSRNLLLCLENVTFLKLLYSVCVVAHTYEMFCVLCCYCCLKCFTQKQRTVQFSYKLLEQIFMKKISSSY